MPAKNKVLNCFMFIPLFMVIFVNTMHQEILFVQIHNLHISMEINLSRIYKYVCKFYMHSSYSTVHFTDIQCALVYNYFTI